MSGNTLSREYTNFKFNETINKNQNATLPYLYLLFVQNEWQLFVLHFSNHAHFFPGIRIFFSKVPLSFHFWSLIHDHLFQRKYFYQKKNLKIRNISIVDSRWNKCAIIFFALPKSTIHSWTKLSMMYQFKKKINSSVHISAQHCTCITQWAQNGKIVQHYFKS